MGVSDFFGRFLLAKKSAYQYSGKLLTLGRMDINFNRPSVRELYKELLCGRDTVTPEEYFTFLGFDVCDSIDYSAKDGANIIQDLNQSISTQLHSKYDFIIDGGTMEHCFDIAQVMKNISNMLKPGGTVIHMNPSIGSPNHCFYSFHPTFYYSFYRANYFKDIDVNYMEYDESTNKLRIVPVDNINNLDYRSHRAAIICRAVKTKEDQVKIPIQEFYYQIYKEKEKVNGRMIADNIYQKIVGNIPENNYEQIMKKSYTLDI